MKKLSTILYTILQDFRDFSYSFSTVKLMSIYEIPESKSGSLYIVVQSRFIFQSTTNVRIRNKNIFGANILWFTLELNFNRLRLRCLVTMKCEGCWPGPPFVGLVLPGRCARLLIHNILQSIINL